MLMGKRLQKIKSRWREKKESYWLETKRQAAHAVGTLAAIMIILLSESSAVKVLTIIVALVAFGYWYISRQQLRAKYFKDFIRNLHLEHKEKEKLLKGADDYRKFEENVLADALKNFLRKREGPLLATFYALLSGLFALLLFGAPFAIIGLLALGIGDAFSTIVGKRWGKRKFFYNKDKSLEGSTAFFVSSFVAISVLLFLLPQYALINPFAMAIIAALFGTLIETIPTANDNATIPVGVSACLWLFLLLL